VDATINKLIPAFAGVKGMQHILRMCLASLVQHREEVLSFGPNHIACDAIPIFVRDPSKMQPAIGSQDNLHSWEDNCSITGVHPHIKQLVDLEAIWESTTSLAESVESW
jgi:hypothetical protein